MVLGSLGSLMGAMPVSSRGSVGLLGNKGLASLIVLHISLVCLSGGLGEHSNSFVAINENIQISVFDTHQYCQPIQPFICIILFVTFDANILQYNFPAKISIGQCFTKLAMVLIPLPTL